MKQRHMTPWPGMSESGPLPPVGIGDHAACGSAQGFPRAAEPATAAGRTPEREAPLGLDALEGRRLFLAQRAALLAACGPDPLVTGGFPGAVERWCAERQGIAFRLGVRGQERREAPPRDTALSPGD